MKMVNSENGEVDEQGYYILVLQYRRFSGVIVHRTVTCQYITDLARIEQATQAGSP